MPYQTGGYPSMETVMNLVRVFGNDWQPGATGTPGEGQITTDNPALSPQTLPAFNSAVRELYRELRNIGAPALIRDNVQVNLPANGATGPGVQTYLGPAGYFDGAVLQPSPILPPDLMFPLELWEQQTGSSLPFVKMSQPEFGLPSPFNQGFALGMWEWRGGATVTTGTGGGDAIWFIGSLTTITIRIRYLAALTQYISPLVFANVFVPIMDCEEFLAYRIAAMISTAITGTTPANTRLDQMGDKALATLKLENIRRQQTVEYHRKPFTTGSTDLGWGNSSINTT